jgi:hypothetical protein
LSSQPRQLYTGPEIARLQAKCFFVSATGTRRVDAPGQRPELAPPLGGCRFGDAGLPLQDVEAGKQVAAFQVADGFPSRRRRVFHQSQHRVLLSRFGLGSERRRPFGRFQGGQDGVDLSLHLGVLSAGFL